jgi:hypothetical protein
VQRAHYRVGEHQADVVTAARGESGEVGVQGRGAGVPGEDVQAAVGTVSAVDIARQFRDGAGPCS